MDQTDGVDATGPKSKTYDGFISYSHAADGLLAPRLQSALQRFAKPWWKRRAVRIFRDESSLSANPHLWASITEALDTSGWLVLLLSPDAAQSEWVGQEIDYWKTHRDPGRILPVVTDGDFLWDRSDVVGSSVPEALRGVFSEEPRWVDVRWARGEEQLDLKDPRFADVVADIASTVRGVAKDELAGEEVRQHRRTIRTAWAGVALIGVLAIAAVGFGLNASTERDRANDLAASAADARDEADAQRLLAESNAEAEAVARAEADRQTTQARARELVASSVNLQEEDPELATLLAIEAVHIAGGVEDALFAEGLISLREATYSNPLVARRELSVTADIDIEFTPDGSGLLIASEADASVWLLDVGDIAGEPLWTYRDTSTNDLIERVVPKPDGSEVAVVMVDDGADDGQPGRIVLLDAATGTVGRVVVLEGCVEPRTMDGNFYGGRGRIGYSPIGEWFFLTVGDTACADEPVQAVPNGQDGFWDTVVLSTSTWTSSQRLRDLDGNQYGSISFTADETRVLISYDNDPKDLPPELRSFPEFELLQVFDFSVLDKPPVTHISPDGDFFVFLDGIRPAFWNVEFDSFRGWGDRVDGQFGDAELTPDGLVLAHGSGRTALYDPATALALQVLPTNGVHAAAIDPAGSLAATASLDGDVELWELGSVAELTHPSEIVWVNPNELIEGSFPAIRTYSIGNEQTFVLDPTTGEIEVGLPTWSADTLPDGRFVMSEFEIRDVPTEIDSDGFQDWEGPLVVRDVTGESVEVLQDCVGNVGFIWAREEPLPCPDGSPLFTASVRVSHDGSRIAAMAVSREIRIWDAETLEVLRTIGPVSGDGLLAYGDGWVLTGLRTDSIDAEPTLYVVDTATGRTIEVFEGSWRLGTQVLTHDGSRLFLMEDGGRAFEYDTQTWDLVRDWQAQDAKSRGIAVSADDSELAVSGEDGLIVIWRVDGEAPKLVQRIPTVADQVSDIMWINDDQFGAVLSPDRGRILWQVIDIPAEAVVDAALDDLVRGLTAAQCSRYRIDPCPSLEEMRGR